MFLRTGSREDGAVRRRHGAICSCARDPRLAQPPSAARQSETPTGAASHPSPFIRGSSCWAGGREERAGQAGLCGACVGRLPFAVGRMGESWRP